MFGLLTAVNSVSTM